MHIKNKTALFCSEIYKLKNEMYTASICILKNDADAQDAIQNALMRSYENLESLRNPNKLKPWVMKILINECYKIADQKKKIESVDIDTITISESDYFADSDANDIFDKIQSIKKIYRDVILLYYYEELSVRDIANALDITESNVKKRLSRARKMLEALLSKEANI